MSSISADGDASYRNGNSGIPTAVASGTTGSNNEPATTNMTMTNAGNQLSSTDANGGGADPSENSNSTNSSRATTGASNSNNSSSSSTSSNSTNGHVSSMEGNHRSGGTSRDSPGRNGGSVTLNLPSRDPSELDIIRIIGQHLRTLGLQRTAHALAEESGLTLDHPLASKLQRHVMDGELEAAVADVDELEPSLLGSNARIKMHFLIFEQKFFELLVRNKPLEALNCLRHQISPLRHNFSRVHELSRYLMITDSNPVLDTFRIDVGETRLTLVERLQKFLPASIMLPPKRLRNLLAKAQYYQLDRCPLHYLGPDNVAGEEELMPDVSLLTDHVCDRRNFPCTTTQILSEHADEVWVCVWSHSGLRLATGSKDSTVILWDLDPETLQLKVRYTLEGHTYGITCISWSPDDSLLLVCGTEDSSDIWMWDTLSGRLRQKHSYSADDSLTACGWQTPIRGSNTFTFLVGGARGQFYYCDLDGTVVDSWEGVRIVYMRCLDDGKTVLAADSHKRIRKYYTDDMREEHFISESCAVMSFAVDKAGKQIVLNLNGQGLHLWDIETKTLVKRFRGVVQGHYTIQSCFGGIGDNFIASGSEDHKVYIFNRSKETPVEVLSGHIRTVNSVAWNPHFPQLLVSASDDGTLRLWGPDTSCGIPSEPNISIDGSSGSIGRADVSTADVSGENIGSDNEMAD
ncbi:WD repeat-containing protein 26-like [Varroa jacobsoni]|uniref:CTLH domain-containing protein n=1 Tax=Varroa destructor TaxID=109461 RepID=A0A7M7MDG9_VARDE|nr:WD repeat-containing protein 26-like [Varroa destructor]XP_022654010.1 WD repeat-containing protein 26-like [Varroa destructor]XP_022695009.1 WD repeat-containing protein 26-like [Varroa jacobsoni]